MLASAAAISVGSAVNIRCWQLASQSAPIGV